MWVTRPLADKGRWFFVNYAIRVAKYRLRASYRRHPEIITIIILILWLSPNRRGSLRRNLWPPSKIYLSLYFSRPWLIFIHGPANKPSSPGPQSPTPGLILSHVAQTLGNWTVILWRHFLQLAVHSYCVVLIVLTATMYIKLLYYQRRRSNNLKLTLWR